MKKPSLTLVVLMAACAAGLSAQQGPTPEMRARLTGFARALTSFDPKSPEAIDKLREEAFTADLKKRLSPEQVRALAARMRQDFGTFTIGEIRRRNPETIVMIVDGDRDDGRIVLGVETAPPHLITSMAVEIGSGDAQEGPAPDINSRMTPAELSAGHRITVRGRADGSEVIIEVANTGSALDDAQRERVFDRLYRADSARQRSTGGTGLGLAIVKSLAEAQGGRVRTEMRGGELVFALRLPSLDKTREARSS